MGIHAFVLLSTTFKKNLEHPGAYIDVRLTTLHVFMGRSAMAWETR